MKGESSRREGRSSATARTEKSDSRLISLPEGDTLLDDALADYTPIDFSSFNFVEHAKAKETGTWLTLSPPLGGWKNKFPQMNAFPSEVHALAIPGLESILARIPDVALVKRIVPGGALPWEDVDSEDSDDAEDCPSPQKTPPIRPGSILRWGSSDESEGSDAGTGSPFPDDSRQGQKVGIPPASPIRSKNVTP